MRSTVRAALCVLCLVIGVVTVGLATARTPPTPIAEPGLTLSDFQANGVPGLAYAVVRDGEIVETGERGVVEISGNEPVRPETAFLIGSISKSFTALAVMQLVEAGEVELDAPISGYLPALDSAAGGEATVRQLLSHTSGFSMYQGNLTQTDFAMDAGALSRRVEQVAEMEHAREAGSQWEYSNANYQLLGRLIEVVSGTDYPSYIEENILRPAGMEKSFVHDRPEREGMATGHRPWFGTKRPMHENLTGLGSAPQGGIISTAGDMARYLQLMMNGEDDLISAESKALMMSPANGASPTYGFGWFVNPAKGIVYHSGSNPGYEALATMVPSERKAVIVLANAGTGTGFGETNSLQYVLSAKAIDLDPPPEVGGWGAKATFVALVALPIIYLLCMVWAWRHREKLRAKSGWFGRFSLWFPLVMTLAAAWVIFSLVPNLFGVPFDAIALFQPDVGLVLAATGISGVVWAVFRLAVAYSGKDGQAG